MDVLPPELWLLSGEYLHARAGLCSLFLLSADLDAVRAAAAPAVDVFRAGVLPRLRELLPAARVVFHLRSTADLWTADYADMLTNFVSSVPRVPFLDNWATQPAYLHYISMHLLAGAARVALACCHISDWFPAAAPAFLLTELYLYRCTVRRGTTIAGLPSLRRLVLVDVQGVRGVELEECECVNRLKADSSAQGLEEVHIHNSALAHLALPDTLRRVSIVGNPEHGNDNTDLAQGLLDNLPYFPRLTHVNFSGTLVADVRGLRDMRSVELISCTRVQDVSALARVKYLDLSDSAAMITRPMENHTLVLEGCHVPDVSLLKRVLVLCLQGCTGVADVSALGARWLDLTHTGAVCSAGGGAIPHSVSSQETCPRQDSADSACVCRTHSGLPKHARVILPDGFSAVDIPPQRVEEYNTRMAWRGQHSISPWPGKIYWDD